MTGRKSWKWTGLVMLAFIVLLAGCGGNKETGKETQPDAAAPSASHADANVSEASDPNANAPEADQPLTKVTLVLDWTPNTNHTGLYAARDLGYWKKRGLDVEIVQPPETGASQMTASGAADFGVGYQEELTLARENDVPLVSLAAIIQHNTSGFAAPVDKNIKTPADFAGKNYGGWGSPVESAVLQTLMQQQGLDASDINIVNIGNADYFTAVKRDIDFAWIYYAWTGIEAELRNEPLDMIWLIDYDKRLDYYTPLLMTSEKMIRDKPEIVRAFVEGAAEGYRYTIDHPAEAAELLIKAVPDLSAELVRASQAWLSPRYQDDAPRWGEQKKEVWEGYADWMMSHGIMEKELDFDKAFTNEFLPE